MSDPHVRPPSPSRATDRRRFLGMVGTGAAVAGASAVVAPRPAGAVTGDEAKDALTRAVGLDVTDPVFGAIGSGAEGTDDADTRGIQAAIDTAVGGARVGTSRVRVVIPPGVYRINAPLVVEGTSVEISGAGIANPATFGPRPGAGTTLVWTGGPDGSVFRIKDSLSSEIRDMLVVSLNGNPGRAAFFLEGSPDNGSTGRNSQMRLRNLCIGRWPWSAAPAEFDAIELHFGFGILVGGHNAENDQFVFENIECDACDVGIAIQGSQHVWGILRNCFVNGALTACVQTDADVLIENLQVNSSPVGLQVLGSPLVKVDQMQGEGVARYLLISGTAAKVFVKGGRMRIHTAGEEADLPPPIEFEGIENGVLSLEGVWLDNGSDPRAPSLRARTAAGTNHDGHLIVRDCRDITLAMLDVAAKPVGPGDGRVIIDFRSAGEVVYTSLSPGECFDPASRPIDYVDERIAADHPTVNDQTDVERYTVTAADAGATILRYAPGTATWPADGDAAIPVGATVVHTGALGPIQHQSGPGASVTGMTVQLPGDTVTAVKIATDGWLLTGTKFVERVNRQGGTSYTLGLVDQGSCLELTSAAPVTVTVPSSSSAPWTTGEVCEVAAWGAGEVTVVGADGVTIGSLGGSTTLAGQYASATLRYRGSDSWHLSGQLA